MNVHDKWSSRLLEQAGVHSAPDPPKQKRAEQRVQKVFKDLDFIVAHAKARIRMGTFRYETADSVPWNRLAKANLVPTYFEKMDEKKDMYKATGNREYLVDMFNYIFLEWVNPCEHETTFFKSTEREE